MSLLLLCSLSAAAPLSELPLSEREPMGLVFRAPSLTGEGRASTHAALQLALEAHTAFRVLELSAEVEESDEPLHAITRAATAASREVAELTLSVSVLPAPGSTRLLVSWQLIQTRRAAAARSESFDQGRPLPDLSGFVLAFELFETEEDAPAEALVPRVMQGLRPTLESAARWREQGSLALRLPAEGFTVEVDGRRYLAEARELTIEHARVGTRRIALEHPDFEPHTEEAKIELGLQTSLAPQLVDRRLQAAAVSRAVVFGSGLALLATGGAFLAVAVAQASAPADRCLMIAGEAPCGTSGASFARLGPVPTAPLGYSLALAGAVLAGGVLTSDETAQPWWWTALGLGLGAAAFTISVVADSPAAVR